MVEIHSEKAITYGIAAIFAFAIAALLFYYRGTTNMSVPLASLLLFGGICSMGYAAYSAFGIRKVAQEFYSCPFCETNNALIEVPDTDFLCVECNRLVPVREGLILTVSQVRCGYCNHLNFYSEKTDVLLCENCNREVPIAHDEGYVSSKRLPTGFAVEDDLRPYELVLVSGGSHTEDLISALQHMLALNRKQVKQMLDEVPVTLLSGVPKKKAEMFRAQIQIHDANAECRPMAESPI